MPNKVSPFSSAEITMYIMRLLTTSKGGETIMTEVQETEGLIKIAKEFFLYDNSHMYYGWVLPVYFDRKSDTFKIPNCPAKGMMLELKELPPDGPYEFETEEPVQYARDCFLTKHKVSVR
jgi:hypothetical protein